MRTLMLILAAVVVLPACRKKAAPPEPVAVVAPPVVVAPPPPPAEPPPPPCPERDAVVGKWDLVTQVADEVGGKLKGLNGFYRMTIMDQDQPDCDAKFMINKKGYGFGSNDNEVNMYGNVETNYDAAKGYWQVPIVVGGGDKKTAMVLWLAPDGDKMFGYWHYTGPSWKEAQMYGIVEARKGKGWAGPPEAEPEAEGHLFGCGLKGRTDLSADACAP